MAWKKGQSGNPGGRPKVEGHVRDLARQHTPEAVRALVGALKDKNGRTRVAAAEALLDRGWGRPLQQIEHTADDELLKILDAAGERARNVRRG